MKQPLVFSFVKIHRNIRWKKLLKPIIEKQELPWCQLCHLYQLGIITTLSLQCSRWKSPPTRLFVCPTASLDIQQENIKPALHLFIGSHMWPVDSTHKGPVWAKRFHVMASSWLSAWSVNPDWSAIVNFFEDITQHNSPFTDMIPIADML